MKEAPSSVAKWTTPARLDAVYSVVESQIVSHRKLEDQKTFPVVGYLANAGCSNEEIAKVFHLDGRMKINRQRDNEIDFETISIEELRTEMRKRLAPVYAMVNRSLDNGHTYGFNTHDLEHHVEEVVNRALAVLDHIGASEEEKKIAVVAGMVHDAGNLLSRTYHPELSRMFLYRRVPEFGRLPQKVQARIEEAIILHDERNMGIYLDKLLEEYSVDESRGYEIVDQKLGQATRALFVADKSHAVDRMRMSSKRNLNGEEALNGDKHLLLSLLGVSLPYEFDQGMVSRTVFFSPRVEPSEHVFYDTYANVPDGFSGSSVRVPKSMHERHKEIGVPRLASWQQLYLKEQAGRVQLEAKILFSLVKDIDMFSILVHDGEGVEGLTIEHKIVRGRVDEGIENLKRLSGAGQNDEYPHRIPSWVLPIQTLIVQYNGHLDSHVGLLALFNDQARSFTFPLFESQNMSVYYTFESDDTSKGVKRLKKLFVAGESKKKKNVVASVG